MDVKSGSFENLIWGIFNPSPSQMQKAFIQRGILPCWEVWVCYGIISNIFFILLFLAFLSPEEVFWNSWKKKILVIWFRDVDFGGNKWCFKLQLKAVSVINNKTESLVKSNRHNVWDIYESSIIFSFSVLLLVMYLNNVCILINFVYRYICPHLYAVSPPKWWKHYDFDK